MTARVLKPIELSAFVDLNIPAPEPMLGPLRRGALALLYGPAGVGKTMFMLGLAMAVRHGVNIFGWHVGKPAPVLYVDGEMSAYSLQQRCVEFCKPIHATIDHAWDKLHIITPDLQPNGIPNIDTPEGQLAVLRLVVKVEPSVVFFDNLSCLTNPEDDNTASSWQSLQELLLALRRREIAVVVGHHAGKGGQQRGTSRRTDILDLVLKLTPIIDPIADGRTRIQVEFEKGRHLASDEKAPFTAILEPVPAGGLMWTRSGAEIAIGDRVRQMLINGMPPGDVASELSTARSFVYRIRTELIEAGEIPGKRTSRVTGQGTGDAT